ncbi:Na+/H+ antiporter [Arthrobacter sp. NtRootA1]|uniref:Na+/H+ antiporter n=1 Tax=Arthrobacter sp. NtRootA1 TaxID=2830983 RepID=UPI001CC49C5F|nr:Na+/H+ antiporter [Arthrobacter sp. NtRootA1]BCW04299.1 putative Na(+)/H(+) exchanger [Arthrobacter sp. NtRootA1]
MEGLETVVLLGVSVLAGAILAPRLRIAAPLLLLVFGLLLGFVPQLRHIELPPETVLLIFLPVMLFWESLTTSLRSIRRDLRGIVIMSTLLVVASALAAAGVAHVLGLPWSAALILGAALAPPDATAVAALGRMLPRRNFMLLKAESLTNDGTALVLYAIAVGLAMGGNYVPIDIAGLFALSYLGGAVAGVLVAGAAYQLLKRISDPLIINIALLITPFAAFLLAEAVGASGVLAVVMAGLIVSFTSGRISTAASRRQTESAWPLGSYLLNGSLFILIGIQVQAAVHGIEPRDVGRLLVSTVAVWATLIVIRFVFQTVSIALIRLLDRRPSQRKRRMSYRARVVSSIAGFRGAVSLAIALSVPSLLSNGTPLPGREDIIFISAGVIVLTMLVQGPLLPAVVRWARLPDEPEEEEHRLAEVAISSAAVKAVDDLAEHLGITPEVRGRVADEYQSHLDAAQALHGGSEMDNTTQSREEEKKLRQALLETKREVLLALRLAGTVDDTVARRIQTRLDIEEQRLTGVETYD